MVSRLPIIIRPAANEIAISYLARLAALHELPVAELWSQVSRRAEGRSPHLDADLLATVASQPLHRLASAVVEVRDPEPDWLALRHEPQPGCRRCDARHAGGPVLRLLPHDRYVCTRHRIWIGPPDQPDHPQPSLDALPEVVTAQHKHLRLRRQLGPAATYDAVLTGFLICAHRWDRIQRTLNKNLADTDAFHHWERRADLLIPPGVTTSAFSASRMFAVLYPEAVSLAEILGPLHWRRLAAGDPDDQRQFTAEVGRRLGQPDYRPRLLLDPIAHWIQQDCWHPPSPPIDTYRATRIFGGPTYRKPDNRAEQSRATSAFWFVENHRGGTTVLHHRSLRPVIFRGWAPRMEKFTGALDNTTHVDYGHAERERYDYDPIAISRAEFVRPQPVESEFLATAVEPVDWHHRAQPPSARRRTRPWLPGEKPAIRRRRRFTNR